MRRDANATFAGPVEFVRRRTPLRTALKMTPALPNQHEVVAELRALESMASKLTVYHSDPHRFFEERSELKSRIGALAKKLQA